MTCSLALVLLLGGVAVCTAQGIPGGYSLKTDHHTNPKYLDLAHFATSSWSAQQPGKTHFDTVEEVERVETQVVAGTNYRMTLKVVESVCELTSTYSKEACTAKANAAHRNCITVIYENLQGEKSVSSFDCAVH
ncbi:salivary cystatin-L-like [Ixodes scapularis]|uniref:Secreted cystatin, putative n=1 Tax=Ixodes scapularis TaxID=6945 RepID=B7PKZ0_IXOSC|nr:salivary cystatin-L-like [Ixodes scapularis]EEC07262.1 secreted cystatin, putative [Ixodes scapularis]|eukprot:XP_002434438.1 secreted cystatin, putative [Ixodes scapularis]